jgi:hypothetical protein
MRSPANELAPKVNGTQSDATKDNREQDIIEAHIRSFLASHNYSGL